MSYLIIPKRYQSLMSVQQTEQGIKLIKEFFSLKAWESMMT